ncbi:MAG: rhodanese-like domain-containing protein [bacterium]|nr:rhodanese-like domain-containing protein [bacterium]
MTDFLQYLQSISEKIQTIEAVEALEHHKATDIGFVDLRDGFELREHGLIPGAMHCPRGSLEFRISANSEYHHDFFTGFKRFVFYCSHGQRSILATHTAQNLGLPNVSHIRGGMIAWVKAGGAVERWTGA